MDLLTRIELQEQLAEHGLQQQAIQSAEYCASCHTTSSPNSDIIYRNKNKLLNDQLNLLEKIANIEQQLYETEKLVTTEKEKQLTIDQHAAKIRLDINRRGGFGGAKMSPTVATELGIFNANISDKITSSNNSGL